MEYESLKRHVRQEPFDLSDWRGRIERDMSDDLRRRADRWRSMAEDPDALRQTMRIHRAYGGVELTPEQARTMLLRDAEGIDPDTIVHREQDRVCRAIARMLAGDRPVRVALDDIPFRRVWESPDVRRLWACLDLTDRMRLWHWTIASMCVCPAVNLWNRLGRRYEDPAFDAILEDLATELMTASTGQPWPPRSAREDYC